MSQTKLNSYWIIDKEYQAYPYEAIDEKDAIYKHACHVGLSIDKHLFQKAISTLNITEAVDLFEMFCLDEYDGISKILSNCSTLYDDRDGEDNK